MMTLSYIPRTNGMIARQCVLRLRTSMALFVKLGALVLILGACKFTHATKPSLPKGKNRDEYCIGCEMTLKVMDKVLRHAPKSQLDVLVPETLHTVCKPDHFDISEHSKQSLAESCEHLVAEHSPMMEPILVSHYTRSDRPSYLDLVQQVCLDMTDACHGVTHDHHNHDPLKDDAKVVLDRDTNEFVVLPGKNLKVAKPVLKSHEEL